MRPPGLLLSPPPRVILLDPALDESLTVPPVEADPAPRRLTAVQHRPPVLGEVQRGAVLAEDEFVDGEPEPRVLAVLLLGGRDVRGVAPADLVLAHPQHVVLDH